MTFVKILLQWLTLKPVKPIINLRKGVYNPMPDSMELSLEQKFNLRSFETEVKAMSHEQAQEFLVKLYEQMILKDNMYQYFIRHQWGIDPSSSL